jgi:DNA glycosylase AlkZ-like
VRVKLRFAAGKAAWLLKSQLPWLEEVLAEDSQTIPQVRLLPRFDTYLLGYASRELAVDPAYARRIHPGGGILNAALLVDGQARGTWKVQRRRGGLEVQVEPFEPLAPALLPGMEAEAADVGRFLGVEAVLSVQK